MRQTGILVALVPEAACLLRHPSVNRPLQLGRGLRLLVSGMGPDNAAAGARALIEDGAEVLIGVGTAGALDPRLAPGNVVIPPRVLGSDGGALSTDAGLAERAAGLLRGQGLAVLGGDLLQTDRVLPAPADKQACFTATGAVAVDMESAAQLTEADRHAIPALVIRAVVDRAGMVIPPGLLPLGDAYGRMPPLPLLGYLLRHPAELPDLWRLGLAFRQARRSLRLVGSILDRLEPA